MRLHKEHGVNPTIPICFICSKAKNEIALLGAKYHGKAPMHMYVGKEPCDKCKGYMEQGVILISVKDGTDKDNPYRTGKFCVIKIEAAKRILPDAYTTSRVCFIEDTAWEKLRLP